MTDTVFTMDDQQAFARLSGDCNPMHVDEDAARRLLFGAPVVHGVHGVLWAMEQWIGAADGRAIVRVRATFSSPVIVDSRVRLHVTRDSDDEVELLLSVGKKTASSIRLTFGECRKHGEWYPDHCPPQMECCSCTGGWAGRAGRFSSFLDRKMLAEMFPNVAQNVADQMVSALLASSFVIGMYCPGLDSLFSSLDLECSEAICGKDVCYKVTDYSELFSRLTIALDAPGIKGELVSFVRPEPVLQLNYAAARRLVGDREFWGARALVVGATRGLGEACAKLLAAGGAHVRMTGRSGREELQALASEISKGDGACSTMLLDSTDNDTGWRDEVAAFSPTHVFYFATPHIGVGERSGFDFDLFSRLGKVYLEGFSNVVRCVSSGASEPVAVYAPSTVFLEELPMGMAEYCCAKAAMETLCDFLRKGRNIAKVHCARLPKTATDQTVGLMPEAMASADELMLAELRAFFTEQDDAV